MRTDVQINTSSTAVLAALIQSRAGADVPVKRDKPLKLLSSKGTISADLDALEEKLAKTGAKLPANPQHPHRPNWKLIAAMLDVKASTLSAKHLTSRKRILDLAERYGLEPVHTPPKAFPFAKFSVIVLAHRDRELEVESAAARDHLMTSFATAMHVVAADCGPNEDARSALVSAVTLAGVKEADLPFDFLDGIKRAISYLDKWAANEELPNNPAHLLCYALARSGLSERSVCIGAGMAPGCILKWIKGGVGPHETLFSRVNSVEQAFNLPRDSVTSRFHAWRRQSRPRPQHRSTEFGRAAQWRIDNPYGMHDWPERLENEFTGWTDFRNEPLCPFDMNRPEGSLSIKTIQMQRDYLEMLFGSWTTDLNPKFRIGRDDVTLGLLVFPRMIQERLEFAMERDKKAKRSKQGFLTKFEIDQIRWVKSLLDPETGWLTQMPQLADRLAPVISHDGKEIISAAHIAKVREDWPAACAAAWEKYTAMKKSNLKHVQISRDPHGPVRPILLLDNPLSALSMIGSGLQRDMAGLDPRPLAYASRDSTLFGILSQTGFRMSTVEGMELDHIFFDAKKGKWCLRVPVKLFKNGFKGPYFGAGFGRREHYERDLLDKHGLYEAIEHYLKMGRALILGECETSALFVVQPNKRPGVRKQFYSWCEEARMTTQYLGKFVHGVSGKYLRYDPVTGAGIPGITSFPGHAIRHIIATGMLKQAVNDPDPKQKHDPWQLAADAIHDGVRTVKIYVQYLPRDRQDILMEMLNRGLAAR
jgi:integrase